MPNNITPPRINIIGAGSIGHLWALKLITQKQDVRLYHRQPSPPCNIELIAPSNSIKSQMTYYDFTQWRDPDLTLICVKAPSLTKLCQTISQFRIGKSTVILVMNGLGLIEIVNNYLPLTTVLQASTTHGAKLIKNRYGLTLQHTGSGETLLGNTGQTASQPDEKMQKIIDIMHASLPNTCWNNHHSDVLLTKLLVNAIINPLTAIHRISNGGIVNDLTIAKKAKILTQELSPFIEKCLPEESWQSIFDKVQSVASQTSSNISSMRQDIIRGRKTEIHFITGYILNRAQELGINMPNHSQIFKQIKALEIESCNSVTN